MPDDAAGPAPTGDALLLARARAAHRRDTVAEARLHGGEVVEVDGLLVAATGLPNGGWNPVHLVRPPHDPVAAFATAGAVRRRHGQPPAVAAPDEADPYAALAARLGLAVGHRARQMVLSPRDAVLPTQPAELTVGEARTAPEVLAHAQVQAEGFLMDSDLLVRYLAPMPAAGYARLLTGEVDGRAVAAAMLVCPPPGDAEPGTASIYGVATLVAARRRGYGAALTARCVALAQEAGADLVQLQPSGVAAGVYRSLGFRELTGQTVWVQPGGGS